MSDRPVIFFARLGPFSGTNDAVHAQLVRNFPANDIVQFSAIDLVRRHPWRVARGSVAAFRVYGRTIFRSWLQFLECFWKTPMMFDLLSKIVVRETRPYGDRLRLTIQTQGLFDGRSGAVPHCVYVDYTLLSEDPYAHRALAVLPGQISRERRLFDGAAAIATVGEHVRSTLEDAYRLPAAKLHDIGIGANVEPVPVSDDLERYARGGIVFVGVDWDRKGGPDLVAAFERIAPRFPQASLTIIGCDPPVSHPRIRVVGRVDKTEVARHLAEASIFCLPSYAEPFGIAVLEATNARLPVVGTRVGGLTSSVADGESGFLVAPGASDALGDALARLLADPELARRFGRAGYERNHIRYSWDEVGRRLSGVLNAIAPEPA